MSLSRVPELKVGQAVCFQFPKKKGEWRKQWHIGIIVAFSEKKNNEVQVVEVRPYEIPETFRLREAEAEWSSLDPLHADFSREAIILNRLDGRARVVMKEATNLVEVPITDLCPATYGHFREALTRSER